MADRKETDLNEYIQNIFSANGVQAPISIEEWTGGWAVIVGGVNGIPTAQQFNFVFYIINAILKEMFSNVSDIQRTANDALPKVNFTASAIVELLKPYGLMVGCDADLLDGKHAEAFALKQHNHAASDINSGVLTIAHGGTGSSDKDIARENLGAAPKQHNHPASDINSGIFPIGRGGTGASSKDAARENLGAAPKQHNTIILHLISTPGSSRLNVVEPVQATGIRLVITLVLRRSSMAMPHPISTLVSFRLNVVEPVQATGIRLVITLARHRSSMATPHLTSTLVFSQLDVAEPVHQLRLVLAATSERCRPAAVRFMAQSPSVTRHITSTPPA